MYRWISSPSGSLKTGNQPMLASISGECAMPRPSRCAFQSFAEVLAVPSGRELIVELVRRNGVVLERAGALIMAGIESSGADADVRRISDEGEQAMRANRLALAEALVGTGEVRAELDAAQVSDVLTTMCSPHAHQVLGRPADRDRDWLTGTLTASLLSS